MRKRHQMSNRTNTTKNGDTPVLSPTRRHWLQRSAQQVAALLLSQTLPLQQAWGENTNRPELPLSLRQALARLDSQMPQPSSAVKLSAPPIADDGSAVAMGMACTLPHIHRLLLLVENNPQPLVAVFHLQPAIEPELLLRVKMDKSSPVYAVAIDHEGQAYFARQDVQVVLGGCGLT